MTDPRLRILADMLGLPDGDVSTVVATAGVGYTQLRLVVGETNATVSSHERPELIGAVSTAEMLDRLFPPPPDGVLGALLTESA